MAGMKFKNTKKKVIKKGKPQKSPRNYRIIPESWNKDEIAFFGGAIIILIAIVVVTYNLFLNLNQENNLANKKISLTRQEIFWREQVKVHPDYRDAYMSLALVEYQLNNLSEAQSNLDKAMALDPNFKEGRELKKILDGK
jgi:tetratricopeptide (TPR) repeat protein